MLRELLLSLNIVVDNEYLDKYIDLIESNRLTPAVKTKTQKHHVVPCSYYKENNLPIDNTQNNLVNLYHYQHILAHWYLFKCAKENYFRYSNSYAVLYMLRIHELPEEEDTIITLAVNYGEVYSDFCKQQSERYKGKPGKTKGRKFTIEQRKRLSESHMGLSQTKETKEKRRQTLLRMYANGEISKSVSEETRKKLSSSIKGRKWINNGERNKQVKLEELESYLNNGWHQGQFLTPEEHMRRSESQLGKVVSEETRKKQSIAAKNRGGSGYNLPHTPYKILSNGLVNKRAYTKERENELVQQGFVYGTLKQVQKQKDKLDKSINEKLWTSTEDQIIKDNYTKITKEELLKLLPNRVWSAIQERASILKVTRPYKRFNKCKCIETGKIYNSFAEASRKCNINADKISNCCNKKQKTAGGLHWEFVMKEIK